MNASNSFFVYTFVILSLFLCLGFGTPRIKSRLNKEFWCKITFSGTKQNLHLSLLFPFYSNFSSLTFYSQSLNWNVVNQNDDLNCWNLNKKYIYQGHIQTQQSYERAVRTFSSRIKQSEIEKRKNYTQYVSKSQRIWNSSNKRLSVLRCWHLSNPFWNLKTCGVSVCHFISREIKKNL